MVPIQGDVKLSFLAPRLIGQYSHLKSASATVARQFLVKLNGNANS